MTGDTAEDVDFTNQMRHGVPFVVAFVLALAFLVLLVAFRSIVVPIKAIVLNLLSVGASYGVLVLVFQHHWAQGVLGFRSDGAIISWLPLFLFVVLFGLSMDYHVFILSRVREGVDAGMSTDDALRHGISRTAGVVSAAALVMVGVFSLFGTASALDLKEAGVGLAVAVLLDATVVRGVLLPATMKLLGERNWYLPRLARRGSRAPSSSGHAWSSNPRRQLWPRRAIDATICRTMRAKVFLLVLAALAAGAGATWLAANASPGRPTEPGPYLTLLVGASLIGSGLASWRARPDSRLGLVMVVTGFLWFAGLLSEATDGAVYTRGRRPRVHIRGRIHLHHPDVPLGAAPRDARPVPDVGCGRSARSPGGRDAVRERDGPSLRRRLRAQPDPAVRRQRVRAGPAQHPAAPRRGPDPDGGRPARDPVAARERAPSAARSRGC